MSQYPTERVPEPNLFIPSPYLDDSINRNAVQSDIDGGVHLRDVAVGAVLEVRTRNHLYLVENLGEGRVAISGHDKYCPAPVTVRLTGSTWGGSMIKRHFVGRHMRMEFVHPNFGVIRTSPVEEICEMVGV